MNVHITLRSVDNTAAGLRSILDRWEQEFPKATARAVSCYSKWEVMLDLPPQTQVIQPQLIDLTAKEVTEDEL